MTRAIIPVASMLAIQIVVSICVLSLGVMMPAVAADLGIDPKLIGVLTALTYLVAAVGALLAAGPIVRLGAVRICQAANVESVLVSEEEIADGMRFLYGRAKLACEPAAAVGVAALLAGKVAVQPTDTVAVVVSGGNVAAEIASAILGSHEGRNPS